MKRVKYLLIFIFCLLVSANLTAQLVEDENSLVIMQYFQSNSNNQISPSLVNIDNNLFISGVQINQIGGNQVADLRLSENDSHTINQLGANNYYSFINYYNSNPSNFSIVQNGVNNSLYIYGENQLVKNISIIQKANNSSLLIRNY